MGLKHCENFTSGSCSSQCWGSCPPNISAYLILLHIHTRLYLPKLPHHVSVQMPNKQQLAEDQAIALAYAFEKRVNMKKIHTSWDALHQIVCTPASEIKMRTGSLFHPILLRDGKRTMHELLSMKLFALMLLKITLICTSKASVALCKVGTFRLKNWARSVIGPKFEKRTADWSGLLCALRL